MQELSLFLPTLPNVRTHESCTDLAFSFPWPACRFLDVMFSRSSPPFYIRVDHLSSLTVLFNLCTIHIGNYCGVDLSERELLQLASSSSRLEIFVVGAGGGCTASSALASEGVCIAPRTMQVACQAELQVRTRVGTPIRRWPGPGSRRRARIADRGVCRGVLDAPSRWPFSWVSAEAWLGCFRPREG